ncbi:MAG: SHD1 domain-containing protein [Thermoguttaceae bacterium]
MRRAVIVCLGFVAAVAAAEAVHACKLLDRFCLRARACDQQGAVCCEPVTGCCEVGVCGACCGPRVGRLGGGWRRAICGVGAAEPCLPEAKERVEAEKPKKIAPAPKRPAAPKPKVEKPAEVKAEPKPAEVPTPSAKAPEKPAAEKKPAPGPVKEPEPTKPAAPEVPKPEAPKPAEPGVPKPEVEVPKPEAPEPPEAGAPKSPEPEGAKPTEPTKERPPAPSTPAKPAEPTSSLKLDRPASFATGLRTWTDKTGRYSVRARFVAALDDGTIRLQQEDGRYVRVAFDRLSRGDQAEVIQQVLRLALK